MSAVAAADPLPLTPLPLPPLRLERLRFGCEALDPLRLPTYSGSAWRGLLGRSLRNSVCVTRAVVSRRDPHTTAKMRSHTSTGELKIGWYRAV